MMATATTYIVVAFLTCISGQCRHEEVPFDGNLAECNVQSQLVVVQWLAVHPERELSGGFACLTGRPA